MTNRRAKPASDDDVQDTNQAAPARRHESWIACAVALVFALAIIALEPGLFSFGRGSHFNWVTLHSLSIVDHSRFDSGFVGYSRKLAEIASDNTRLFHYEYFNRYPAVFPVLANAFLDRFRESAEGYLLASKQIMNLVYVATLLFLYLSLRALRFSGLVSSLSLLSVGASPLWLHYRPMFHFDQPGLLGYVLCMYGYTVLARQATSRAEQSRNSIVFLVCSAIGCLLGRSFIAVFFLAAISITLQFRQSSSRLRRLSWTATALGGSLVIASALYAAVVEWILNRKSVAYVKESMDSSVIQSAMRRLGLPMAQWPDSQKPQLEWSSAIQQYLEWIANLIPTWPFLLLLVLSLGLLSRRLLPLSKRRILARRPGPTLSQAADPRLGAEIQRPSSVDVPSQVLIAAFLASLAWLLFFKNLIVFHDYTMIFLVPFLVILAAFVYRSFVAWLEESMRYPRLRALTFTALLLVLSFVYVDGYLDSVRAWKVDDGRAAPMHSFYKDIDAFNSLSRSASPPVLIRRDDEWIDNSPYAQGVLLEGDLVLDPGDGRAQRLQPPGFPIPGQVLTQATIRSKRQLAAGSLKQVFYRDRAYYAR
ncbi:hypothetical protein FQK07_07945 [Synechococcus sp. BSF8S]|uniref:hypothetical protein n=1 Tax=Synechococcales TaxID=1890424 RepID=UPI001624D9AF|nr:MULTISPECIES: hypothetical protein [unclassified Synechococcus]MBC1261207.1 hypothetical protein [Synechococcus sp. BSF8S]MBC1264110.1 hypothetical protein [Synechococcus sp. BSA11S]